MPRKNALNTQFFSRLPKALLGNILIMVAALVISQLVGGPQIYIEKSSAIIIFFAALVLFIAILFWTIKTHKENPQANSFITSGPYRYSRHPIPATIIFILNPAFGVLFRYWLMVLASILIYFIWKKYTEIDEIELYENFRPAYQKYAQSTGQFFPNLYRLNKFLFYPLTAAAIFTMIFIGLNFPALYLRWVTYAKPTGIVYDDPGLKTSASPFPTETFIFPDQLPLVEAPTPTNSQAAAQPGSASYNDNPNTIIISKINITAPIIQPAGTSQKELNAALNQGVIIYPGSALPGQNGEVALSGHSSVFPWVSTKYGQVFTLLDKLEAGDVVSIVYNHQQFDYRIIGKEVLMPNNVKILETSQPKLKLVTCWPIGTANKRLVVYGELIR